MEKSNKNIGNKKSEERLFFPSLPITDGITPIFGWFYAPDYAVFSKRDLSNVSSASNSTGNVFCLQNGSK